LGQALVDVGLTVAGRDVIGLLEILIAYAEPAALEAPLKAGVCG
jgi:hypothetical protein